MAVNATKSLAAQQPWQTALRSLNWSELSVPVAVLGIVLAMITPLPPIILDVLISANITMSIVILLSAMYITKPSEFNVFPTMLLLMTLFRLALNISSSRLILLQGNTGTRAAGDVIESFGNFVVGGNYVIGTVVFLVLIAIQYVVINHGAVRISEVTARFTLDAMPGKQMSIDSDLNAGLIDEAQARARRKALAAEAEFYGAMDGASRFTQRDAIASILITSINIVAGFLIGVLQHGMDLQRALQTYTVLTIGDGLVTVIPALMISVCGGLIVTRASSDSKLGADVKLQIFSKSQPLLLAGGVLLAMALFPGLPKIPFIVLGAGAGYAGWTLKTAGNKKSKAPAQTKQAKAAENLENLLKVEPVAIEVGLGLVRMVEGGQNSVLLSRISMIRKQLASEAGYLLPPVRVTDNLQLKAREYTISIKGLEVARYELQAGCEMAIQPAQPAAVVPAGVSTKEPAFNMPAVWINPDQVEKAKQLGYTVVDPVSVVGTHFTEVIRKYAAELLTRQETKRILDRVGQDNGKLIEDLVPKQISLATVQKVIQNLLRERISIRDVVTILEALGEAASLTKNSVLMTEFVRQSIKRSIVRPLLTGPDLAAYFVDNEIEKKIEGATEHGEYSSHLNLPPQEIRLIIDKFQRVFTANQSNSVVLSSASCRYFLRQVLENSLPALSIISHNELPPGVRVVSLGTVK